LFANRDPRQPSLPFADQLASFGLDRSTYDHLRTAQQSQSIAGANRKYSSNQREAAIATFGLRPVAQ
jgi:hypothetical protein